jgi:serine protease inhibitor ecotin
MKNWNYYFPKINELNGIKNMYLNVYLYDVGTIKYDQNGKLNIVVLSNQYKDVNIRLWEKLNDNNIKYYTKRFEYLK